MSPSQSRRGVLRRVGAAGLAAIVLAVQGVFPHAVEANLWSERRAAAQRARRSEAPSSPAGDLLASLPQARPAPINVVQEFSPSPWRGEGRGEGDAVLHPLLAVVAPFGSVREVVLSKNASAPLIVHVQDAHGVLEAQRNIAAIIEAVSPSLVALEGAAGGFITDEFRAWPDKGITRDIADFLLEEGLITGAERAGLAAEAPLKLWGVEDMALYRRNVRAFLDARRLKPSLDKALAALAGRAAALKEKTYSGELKSFDQKTTAFHSHALGLADYVEYLSGPFDRRPDGALPNLALLRRALALEKSLDFKAVDAQRRRLVERLAGLLDRAELEGLMGRGLELRAGRLSHGAFHVALRDLCRAKGLRLEEFSPLGTYLDYVGLAEAVDRGALLEELAARERAVGDALAATPSQEQLLAASRRLALLSKLAGHAMSPGDWAAYEADRAGVLGLPAELAALAGGPAGGADGLAATLAPFEDFCRLAVLRNDALAENLLREKPRTAVLVAGGFHTDGLVRALRAKGASVAVVTPKITEVPKGDNYLDVFLADTPPLEKLFSGETVRMVRTPPLAAGTPGEEAALGLAPSKEVVDTARALEEVLQTGTTEAAVGDGPKRVAELSADEAARRAALRELPPAVVKKIGPRFAAFYRDREGFFKRGWDGLWRSASALPAVIMASFNVGEVLGKVQSWVSDTGADATRLWEDWGPQSLSLAAVAAVMAGHGLWRGLLGKERVPLSQSALSFRILVFPAVFGWWAHSFYAGVVHNYGLEKFFIVYVFIVAWSVLLGLVMAVFMLPILGVTFDFRKKRWKPYPWRIGRLSTPAESPLVDEEMVGDPLAGLVAGWVADGRGELEVSAEGDGRPFIFHYGRSVVNGVPVHRIDLELDGNAVGYFKFGVESVGGRVVARHRPDTGRKERTWDIYQVYVDPKVRRDYARLGASLAGLGLRAARAAGAEELVVEDVVAIDFFEGLGFVAIGGFNENASMDIRFPLDPKAMRSAGVSFPEVRVVRKAAAPAVSGASPLLTTGDTRRRAVDRLLKAGKPPTEWRITLLAVRLELWDFLVHAVRFFRGHANRGWGEWTLRLLAVGGIFLLSWASPVAVWSVFPDVAFALMDGFPQAAEWLWLPRALLTGAAPFLANASLHLIFNVTVLAVLWLIHLFRPEKLPAGTDPRLKQVLEHVRAHRLREKTGRAGFRQILQDLLIEEGMFRGEQVFVDAVFPGEGDALRAAARELLVQWAPVATLTKTKDEESAGFTVGAEVDDAREKPGRRPRWPTQGPRLRVGGGLIRGARPVLHALSRRWVWARRLSGALEPATPGTMDFMDFLKDRAAVERLARDVLGDGTWRFEEGEWETFSGDMAEVLLPRAPGDSFSLAVLRSDARRRALKAVEDLLSGVGTDEASRRGKSLAELARRLREAPASQDDAALASAALRARDFSSDGRMVRWDRSGLEAAYRESVRALSRVAVLSELPSLMSDGIVRTQLLARPPPPGEVLDVAVVGAGPAGLAAALHSRSRGFSVALIEGRSVARSFSDEAMPGVQRLRSRSVANSLFQPHFSDPLLVDAHGMPAHLSMYRSNGQRAEERFYGRELLGVRSLKDVPGDPNEISSARNEVFQHYVHMAEVLAEGGGYLLERSPVDRVRWLAEEGLWELETSQGFKVRARNLVRSQGQAGSYGEHAVLPPSFKAMAEELPGALFHLTDLRDLARDNERFADLARVLAEGKRPALRPILSSPLLGRPEVQDYVRRLPAGTRVPVVGGGQSAASAVLLICRLNPRVKVLLFTETPMGVSESSIAEGQAGTERLLRMLFDPSSTQREMELLRSFGTPITPDSARAIQVLAAQGRVKPIVLGSLFSPGGNIRYRLAQDGSLELSTPDPGVQESLAAQGIGQRVPGDSRSYVIDRFDGPLVSAVGYSRGSLAQDPLTRQLMEQGQLRMEGGEIALGSDGLSSALNPTLFVAGVQVRQIPVDATIRGGVVRGARIARQLAARRDAAGRDLTRGGSSLSRRSLYFAFGGLWDLFGLKKDAGWSGWVYMAMALVPGPLLETWGLQAASADPTGVTGLMILAGQFGASVLVAALAAMRPGAAKKLRQQALLGLVASLLAGQVVMLAHLVFGFSPEVLAAAFFAVAHSDAFADLLRAKSDPKRLKLWEFALLMLWRFAGGLLFVDLAGAEGSLEGLLLSAGVHGALNGFLLVVHELLPEGHWARRVFRLFSSGHGGKGKKKRKDVKKWRPGAGPSAAPSAPLQINVSSLEEVDARFLEHELWRPLAKAAKDPVQVGRLMAAIRTLGVDPEDRAAVSELRQELTSEGGVLLSNEDLQKILRAFKSVAKVQSEYASRIRGLLADRQPFGDFWKRMSSEAFDEILRFALYRISVHGTLGSPEQRAAFPEYFQQRMKPLAGRLASWGIDPKTLQEVVEDVLEAASEVSRGTSRWTGGRELIRLLAEFFALEDALLYGLVSYRIPDNGQPGLYVDLASGVDLIKYLASLRAAPPDRRLLAVDTSFYVRTYLEAAARLMGVTDRFGALDADLASFRPEDPPAVVRAGDLPIYFPAFRDLAAWREIANWVRPGGWLVIHNPLVDRFHPGLTEAVVEELTAEGWSLQTGQFPQGTIALAKPGGPAGAGRAAPSLRVIPEPIWREGEAPREGLLAYEPVHDKKTEDELKVVLKILLTGKGDASRLEQANKGPLFTAFEDLLLTTADNAARVPSEYAAGRHRAVLSSKHPMDDPALGYPTFYLPMLADMKARRAEFEGKIVEDIGTGNGPLAHAALHWGARRVVGVDVDLNALKNAQESLEAAGKKGFLLTKEEWKKYRAKGDEDFILIHAGLEDWFDADPETRRAVMGGDSAFRVSNFGPGVGPVYDVLKERWAEDRKPGVAGGFSPNTPMKSTLEALDARRIPYTISYLEGPIGKQLSINILGPSAEPTDVTVEDARRKSLRGEYSSSPGFFSRDLDDLAKLHPYVVEVIRGLPEKGKVLFIGPGYGFEVLAAREHGRNLDIQSLGREDLFSHPDLAERIQRRRRELSREQAEERVAYLKQGFHRRDLNMGPLPFADGTFDAVIVGTAVTAYFDDEWAVIREMHRVLKPDGIGLTDLAKLRVRLTRDAGRPSAEATVEWINGQPAFEGQLRARAVLLEDVPQPTAALAIRKTSPGPLPDPFASRSLEGDSDSGFLDVYVPAARGPGPDDALTFAWLYRVFEDLPAWLLVKLRVPAQTVDKKVRPVLRRFTELVVAPFFPVEWPVTLTYSALDFVGNALRSVELRTLARPFDASSRAIKGWFLEQHDNRTAEQRERRKWGMEQISQVTQWGFGLGFVAGGIAALLTGADPGTALRAALAGAGALGTLLTMLTHFFHNKFFPEAPLAARDVATPITPGLVEEKARAMHEARRQGKWDLYGRALLEVMDGGLIPSWDDLLPYLRELAAQERELGHMTKALVKALELGLAPDMDAVEAFAGRLADASWWHDYVGVWTGAVKAGLVVDRTELDIPLRRLLSKTGMGAAYSHDLLQAWQDRPRGKPATTPSSPLPTDPSLPPFYRAAVATLPPSVPAGEREALMELGRDVLRRVRERAAEPEMLQDHRIDEEELRLYLLPGLAKLSCISANVAKQLVDRYLDQRGHLPLLRDLLEAAAFLSPAEVELLQTFYRERGGRLVNQPDLLPELIGYLAAYKSLDLTAEDFRADLWAAPPTVRDVTGRLGRRVVSLFAERLGVEVDLSDSSRALEGWDLEYLGILVASRGQWPAEERALFDLLFRAHVAGIDHGLLQPASYASVPLEAFRPEDRPLAQRVRRHALAILKRMEAKGLNVGAWLRPDEAVPPRDLAEPGTQRRPSDLLGDFRDRLAALRRAAAAAGEDGEEAARVVRSLGAYASIGEEPGPGLIREVQGNLAAPKLAALKEWLARLEGRHRDGPVHGAAVDARRAVEALLAFDPAKPASKSFLRVGFWRRSLGRDTFIGNKVSSCTALGRNGWAIVQFLLDWGDHYVVIEDERGRPRGYARVFLVEDARGEVVLVADTMDGPAVSTHEAALYAHISAFADALGIRKWEFRSAGGSAAKLGGALSERYFHHVEGLSVPVSHPDASVDGWRARDGWGADASAAPAAAEVVPLGENRYQVTAAGRSFVIAHQNTGTPSHPHGILRVEGAPEGQGDLIYRGTVKDGKVVSYWVYRVNSIVKPEGGEPTGAGFALTSMFMEAVSRDLPVETKLGYDNDENFVELLRQTPRPTLAELQAAVAAFRFPGVDYSLSVGADDMDGMPYYHWLLTVTPNKSNDGSSRLLNPEVFDSPDYFRYRAQRKLPNLRASLSSGEGSLTFAWLYRVFEDFPAWLLNFVLPTAAVDTMVRPVLRRFTELVVAPFFPVEWPVTLLYSVLDFIGNTLRGVGLRTLARPFDAASRVIKGWFLEQHDNQTAEQRERRRWGMEQISQVTQWGFGLGFVAGGIAALLTGADPGTALRAALAGAGALGALLTMLTHFFHNKFFPEAPLAARAPSADAPSPEVVVPDGLSPSAGDAAAAPAPRGRITFGTTSPGRNGEVDVYAREWLRANRPGGGAVVAEVGVGFPPDTVLDLADAVAGAARVVGVDLNVPAYVVEFPGTGPWTNVVFFNEDHEVSFAARRREEPRLKREYSPLEDGERARVVRRARSIRRRVLRARSGTRLGSVQDLSGWPDARLGDARVLFDPLGKAARERDNLSFVKGDAALSGVEGPVDVVRALNVFLYYGDAWAERTLASAAGRLTEGGVYIVGDNRAFIVFRKELQDGVWRMVPWELSVELQPYGEGPERGWTIAMRALWDGFPGTRGALADVQSALGRAAGVPDAPAALRAVAAELSRRGRRTAVGAGGHLRLSLREMGTRRPVVAPPAAVDPSPLPAPRYRRAQGRKSADAKNYLHRRDRLERGLDHVEAHPDALDLVRRLPPGSKVLVVGPGYGFEVLDVMKHGRDLNVRSLGREDFFDRPELVELIMAERKVDRPTAERMVQALKDGFRLHDLNAGRLPFPNGTFDAVIVGTRVVDYVEDEWELVRDVFRVLKIDGTALTDASGLRVLSAAGPWTRRSLEATAAFLGSHEGFHGQIDARVHEALESGPQLVLTLRRSSPEHLADPFDQVERSWWRIATFDVYRPAPSAGGASEAGPRADLLEPFTAAPLRDAHPLVRAAYKFVVSVWETGAFQAAGALAARSLAAAHGFSGLTETLLALVWGGGAFYFLHHAFRALARWIARVRGKEPPPEAAPLPWLSPRHALAAVVLNAVYHVALRSLESHVDASVYTLLAHSLLATLFDLLDIRGRAPRPVDRRPLEVRRTPAERRAFTDSLIDEEVAHFARMMLPSEGEGEAFAARVRGEIRVSWSRREVLRERLLFVTSVPNWFSFAFWDRPFHALLFLVEEMFNWKIGGSIVHAEGRTSIIIKAWNQTLEEARESLAHELTHALHSDSELTGDDSIGYVASMVGVFRTVSLKGMDPFVKKMETARSLLMSHGVDGVAEEFRRISKERRSLLEVAMDEASEEPSWSYLHGDLMALATLELLKDDPQAMEKAHRVAAALAGGASFRRALESVGWRDGETPGPEDPDGEGSGPSSPAAGGPAVLKGPITSASAAYGRTGSEEDIEALLDVAIPINAVAWDGETPLPRPQDWGFEAEDAAFLSKIMDPRALWTLGLMARRAGPEAPALGAGLHQGGLGGAYLTDLDLKTQRRALDLTDLDSPAAGPRLKAEWRRTLAALEARGDARGHILGAEGVDAETLARRFPRLKAAGAVFVTLPPRGGDLDVDAFAAAVPEGVISLEVVTSRPESALKKGPLVEEKGLDILYSEFSLEELVHRALEFLALYLSQA